MTPKKQEQKPKTETQPAPTAPPPATATQTASKQQATVAKLKAAWTERKINLDQLTEKQDGKFALLQPTPDWPVIRVGPTGGVELPQIRSYAKAWDAAIDGLAVWQKQKAGDQKKSASSAPAQAPKPQPAPTARPETPTARKTKEHRSLEAQLA